MAKNERNVEGPFLGRSKGTLSYTGAIPDYGKVTNEKTYPVTSNRTECGPGTPRGNVKNVRR